MLTPKDVSVLYEGFTAPINRLDCGEKCAPYNGGLPFCCDIRHAVPTAYPAEWEHLRARTDLWRIWQPDDAPHREHLQNQAGELVLLECRMLAQPGGACRRELRTFVCRAFPFFPYFDSAGCFLGLSVYWEYADRCWVISNLQIVEPEYRTQFIHTYERLFARLPEERASFAAHSAEMRRVFRARRRAIPILHRNGNTYKISPATERLRRIRPESFPKYGPYKIADALLFTL